MMIPFSKNALQEDQQTFSSEVSFGLVQKNILVENSSQHSARYFGE